VGVGVEVGAGVGVAVGAGVGVAVGAGVVVAVGAGVVVAVGAGVGVGCLACAAGESAKQARINGIREKLRSKDECLIVFVTGRVFIVWKGWFCAGALRFSEISWTQF
jgi:hypothetical protein